MIFQINLHVQLYLNYSIIYLQSKRGNEKTIINSIYTHQSFPHTAVFSKRGVLMSQNYKLIYQTCLKSTVLIISKI